MTYNKKNKRTRLDTTDKVIAELKNMMTRGTGTINKDDVRFVYEWMKLNNIKESSNGCIDR